MSWESTSTESTSDASCGSITTGYISIPQSDSSDDVDSHEIKKPLCRTGVVRQDYRGQLRIDTTIIGRYICNHIIAARNVSTETRDCPDCFVEITILPESRVNSKCISTIYHRSFRPVFDEKISMELPVDFESKRLLIRLWHVRPNSRGHEFLGCMSFGLHRVFDGAQLASGWYYILEKEVGMRRHVKVLDNSASLKKHPTATNNISKVFLCRNEDGGFGFSVIGSRPVRICRVKDGSMAALHNLRPNDAILSIDVYDARNLSSVQVASIIRNIKVFTCMVIQRGSQYVSDENEDRINNGIVGKHIKKILFEKTKMNKPSKNVLVDYGWLENGDPQEEETGQSRGLPFSSLPKRSNSQQFQQSNSLRDSNFIGYPKNPRAVPPNQKEGRIEMPRTQIKRWNSLSDRGNEDVNKILDEDEVFDDHFMESSIYRSERNLLSPVAENDVGLNDSSMESDGHFESRIVSVGRKENAFLNETEIIAGSFDDDFQSGDRHHYSYENPSMCDVGEQNNTMDDNNADEVGNLALGSSKLSVSEDDDHKENTPLLLNTNHFQHSRDACSKKDFPLTPKENLPSFAGSFITPNSEKDNSSTIQGRFPTHKYNRSKNVVSRVRTIFTNKHAS